MLKRYLYDIESYKNFFCVTFKDYDTKEVFVFEISIRKNDIFELLSFLKGNILLIAFNNHHYDDLLLNYVIKNSRRLINSSYIDICKELKYLTNKIIEEEDELYIRPYKYNLPFKTIDLFRYWSKKARIDKKLSLKSLAVNMNWHKIQDLPIPPDALIEESEIELLLLYNLNDVEITEELCKRLKDDINLRYAAKKKYGFDCLSWDGVKLGYNILIKRYCDRTGNDEREVKQLRTIRESVDLKDIIFPFIQFDKGNLSYETYIKDKKLIYKFKSFDGLLNHLKSIKVTTVKEIGCEVYYNNNRYDIGSGGLHTYHNPTIFTPEDDEEVWDIDVSSYYPSLGALWNIAPEHLGKEFSEELDTMRLERIDLKHRGLGKSSDANLSKLAMNGGFFGNLKNEYTAMLDMKAFLKITINGQLSLMMLSQNLTNIGAQILMCNTDGVTFKIKKNLLSKAKEICSSWETMTKMELEWVKYEKIIVRDINNYLALYYDKGKLTTKEKGAFMTDPELDKSRDLLVISKAIKEYYLNNTDIESFIRNHENIYDFCSCQKVGRDYKVYHNNQVQQKLNRYYISKKGAFLYKSQDGVNMQHMFKGFGVKIFNNYEDKEDYEIDYNFYISECRKVLNELEPLQLSLF